jgi:hypothetical protein
VVVIISASPDGRKFRRKRRRGWSRRFLAFVTRLFVTRLIVTRLFVTHYL